MKHTDARTFALSVIADAKVMNASSEHAESFRRAKIAEMVVDLANQIDIITTGGVQPVEEEPRVVVPMRSLSNV